MAKSSKLAKPSGKVGKLAVLFHSHICNNAAAREQVADRDGTHSAFVAFYEQLVNDNGGNNDGSAKPLYTLRLEALVMTRMRQMRLLRSNRYGDRVVLMTFANADGTFPPMKERGTIRKQMLQNKAESEEDKHGVAIVLHKGEAKQTTELGATATFQLFVKWNNNIDNNGNTNASDGVQKDDLPTVRLESITVNGPHRRLFQLQVPFALPWSIREDLATRTVTLTVVPPHIGKFRCSVRFHFALEEKPNKSKDTVFFFIDRYISATGTMNPAMDEALKPISVYQKKLVKDRKVDMILRPPEKMRSSFNPFEELPMYFIPTDVKEILEAEEMERVLERPNISPLTGEIEYATFWKHLLWANEFQDNEDIKLYDMDQQELKLVGKSWVLQVPGLAESRPSVLMGDTVKIFWNRHMYLGRVTCVKLLEVHLDLHSKFKKNFSPTLDRVSVRFCLSRTTYRTSHHGCVQAEKSMTKLLLLPDRPMVESMPRLEERQLPRNCRLKWANRNLNPEQQAAVLNIVKGSTRPLPYCIFGPPGTGKTTTLIEAVYQLATTCKAKILLVAPSNDAADILLERLAVYFPPSELKRVLAYSRSADTVPGNVREYVVETKAAETTPGENENQQHEQCCDIMTGRIVVATVNFAARFGWIGVPKGHFDVLCVDEAGHATEPEVVSVAANLMDFFQNDGKPGNGQMVLAGDPRQLGPVVTSELCRRFGMEESYMERLMKTDVYGRRENGTLPAEFITKLVRNYRSHPSIIKLPNEKFYDNELVCSADHFVSHNMAKWEHLPSTGFPLLFHGLDGYNQREGNSPSWFNPQEVMQVVQYVKLLTTQSKPALKAEDIGIITPYHRQAQKIRTALKLESLPEDIKVGSVETFQGQERRVIIVSTVRASVEHVASDIRFNLGFVASEKRFNVAITRAKALLIVVGCPSVLALDKDNWLPFLKFCYDNKAMVGEEWDPSHVESL